MTDRYDHIMVVLEEDMRDDDAEGILDAIRRIRGVAAVLPHVVDANDAIERSRARFQLLTDIIKLFQKE